MKSLETLQIIWIVQNIEADAILEEKFLRKKLKLPGREIDTEEIETDKSSVDAVMEYIRQGYKEDQEALRKSKEKKT